MIKIDAMGDVCPIPVVKTRKAIQELSGSGEVEVLVDNEIAVQNLTNLARHNGYQVVSHKLSENKYQVNMIIKPENVSAQDSCCAETVALTKNKVVVISSDKMGEGAEELGRVLIKSFIYALTQQNDLPASIILYNSGANLSCEGSDSLGDLLALEANGVDIITCGTCLNYYGLSDKLAVGRVSNMYDIVDSLTKADLIVRP